MKNILNKKLKHCSLKPLTGYMRDGYCRPMMSDYGSHLVCAKVNNKFLDYTASKGNDLRSVVKNKDKWCLCQDRWLEAYEDGVAPKVIENATSIKVKKHIKKLIKTKKMKNGGGKKTKKLRKKQRVLLPKLRKIDKSKKKHHYHIKDPQKKRILAIEEGIHQEKNKTRKSRRTAAAKKKARFNILRIYRRNKDKKGCRVLTKDMKYMDKKYKLGKTKKICGGRRKKKKTKKKKCIKKNKYSVRIDPGYPDKYRGWYDVQKCGKCQDYCRWVGNSGPGGNPKFRTKKKIKGKKKSWWSCWLADASEGKTLYSSNKRWKKSFNYKRCTREGNTTKLPNSKTGENWNF